MSETRPSIVLYPASVEPEIFLGEALPECDLIVVAISSTSVKDWQRVVPDAEVFEFHELRKTSRRWGSPGKLEELLVFYDQLLSDPRTLLMMERQWAPGLIDVSVFNLLPRLSEVCWNVLAFLSLRRPTAVVFHSTPHLVEAWVLAKFAEYLSIPVLIAARGVLPGSARVVAGIDGQALIPPTTDGIICHRPQVTVRDEVVAFMDGMRSRYAQAAPPAHGASLRRSPRGGWSIEVEWEAIRRHVGASKDMPGRISRILYSLRRSLTRRALWRSYLAHVKEPPRAEHLITLFLHYQPERTTLPEAGRYVNQFELARTIAHAIPEGWVLRVREHPATFVGPGAFYPMFRSSKLYAALASLPRTFLTALDMDPFDLVDASEVVVTCTGTVGLESLCRGTPVIVAGRAAYRDAPGTLDLGAVSPDGAIAAISRFCEDVCAGRVVASSAELEDYLVAKSRGDYGVDRAWSHEVSAQEAADGIALRAAIDAIDRSTAVYTSESSET
jgi:hypothetical protein